MMHWMSEHVLLMAVLAVVGAYTFVLYEAFTGYFASCQLAAMKRLNKALSRVIASEDIEHSKKSILILYASFSPNKSFAKLFVQKFKEECKKSYQHPEIDASSYAKLQKRKHIIDLENNLIFSTLDVSCCVLRTPWTANILTSEMKKIIAV